MARRSRRTNHPSNMENTPSVKYKIAAYCRLSNTNEESESLQNQIEYVEKYIAEQLDMELTARFGDEGETGTNYDRKGFQNMMTAIQKGQINCVVVKDLSRLGRNFLESGRRQASVNG